MRRLLANKLNAPGWKSWACALVLILVSYPSSHAADLIGVYPVSPQILMLRFSEGHIDYSGINAQNGAFEGQFGNFQILYYSLLDTLAAQDPNSYSLRVGGTSYIPSAVYLKGKGKEYNDTQASDGEPDELLEYEIYLVLPITLAKGQSYTLDLGNLADNTDEFTWVFEEETLWSPSIHVNQLGFLPNQSKYAYLSQWMGRGGPLDLSAYVTATWGLYDLNSGLMVRSYSGFSLQKAKEDQDNNPYGNFSLADVWELDFSDFNTPGSYKIVVEGFGASYPFEIRENVYRDAYYTSMRGLFYQRSGITRRMDEYEGQSYPRAHHSDMNTFYYDSTQKVYRHQDISAFSYALPINQRLYGWYNDAGDWDYYHRHWSVPPALMLLYLMKPDQFADGAVGNQYKLQDSDPTWVQEGGNGIPDILDEARWMLEFGRRFKNALMVEGYGTGGVPGYVGEEGGAGGVPSWADTRDMRVTAEMPGSTFSYAGTAALYAHCLNQVNLRGGNVPSFEITLWTFEAINAFKWANARFDINSAEENQARQLAAVGLYLLTGDSQYQSVYRESHEADNASQNFAMWLGLDQFGVSQALYSLFCAGKANLDTDFYNGIVSQLTRRADRVSDEVLGYRLGGVEQGQWQRLNLITVGRTFYQAVVYELTGDSKYLESVYNTVAYHLGGNPENLSMMTGIGDNPELDAFHIDSWYLLDYNDQVYRNPILPGFTVYGRRQFDVGGIGSELRAMQSFVPTLSDIGTYAPWPIAEGRSRSRWSISGSEFTVNQNNIWSIFAFGYLADSNPAAFVPNQVPSVEVNFTDYQEVNVNEVPLSVFASSDVARVEYYYEWHFIGASEDASSGFSLDWDAASNGYFIGDTAEVTAVAFDERGLVSIYEDAVDKFVIFTDIQLTFPGTEPAFPGIPRLEEDLRIYPNPSKGARLSIDWGESAQDLEKLKLVVSDLQNRVLWEVERPIETREPSWQIQTPLPQGVYILSIFSERALLRRLKWIVY